MVQQPRVICNVELFTSDIGSTSDILLERDQDFRA